MEGDHELRDEAFTKRMFGHQGRELTDDFPVPSKPKLNVRPQFKGVEVLLVESLRRSCKSMASDARERGAADYVDGFPEHAAAMTSPPKRARCVP